MEEGKEDNKICNNCNRISSNENHDKESLIKCEQWLQKCSVSDVASTYSEDTSFISESESEIQGDVSITYFQYEGLFIV